MRYPLVLLCGLLFACGQADSNSSENSLIEADSVANGIVEYDLNENRLSAVDFNNELTLIQQHALNQVDLIYTSDSASVDLNRENALFELELKLADLSNMDVPEGGEPFLSSIRALLAFYRDEIRDDFLPVTEALKKETLTKEDETLFNEYNTSFMQREDTLFSNVKKEQDAFAAANNIKMQDL